MDRRVIPAATILGAALLAPLLSACMPDSPRTELSWDANDSLTRHYAPATNKAGPQYVDNDSARTYVYQGDAYAVPAPKPRPNPSSGAIEQRNLPPPSNAPTSASVAFAWPVQGPVISNFGAGAGGTRNDGINIAIPSGTPIRAAASGTVTYAGDELKDYGNLLLIRHADGYVTAYAHADTLIVKKGQSVTQGEVIAFSGSTGDVSSPQLHFEIRHGTQPLNPSGLLVARNPDAAKSGQIF
jgi:murein DD-endopeptidase MepM/ murein hydrolase activator NlpD